MRCGLMYIDSVPRSTRQLYVLQQRWRTYPSICKLEYYCVIREVKSIEFRASLLGGDHLLSALYSDFIEWKR